MNGTKVTATTTKTRKRKCRAQKTTELITNYFSTENLKSSIDLKSPEDKKSLEENHTKTIGMYRQLSVIFLHSHISREKSLYNCILYF